MLSKKLKTTLIIVGIILVVGMYVVGRIAYFKYKWAVEKLEKVEMLERFKDTIEARQMKEVYKISNAVVKSRESKNKINQTLKQNEETIDNSSYTDKQRKEFLSRFND